MKKLLLLATLFASGLTFGQGSAGLIAHWNMDGGVTDVSGNLHNGTPHSLTPTTDRFGRPNSAYYFDGLNSYVTAPYKPDLNLTQFTLCAIVKVMGFNSGLCEVNTVIERGAELNPGSFFMRFYDNAYNSCGVFDSTKETFTACAGSYIPSTEAAWQYTPNIARNTWYRVVTHWNGTVYKIFVNGALINTVTPASGSMGTSTDSISIGHSIYSGVTYPYNFKGMIDDIRIYDRVLTDSETVHYGDTCGVVTASPVSVAKSVGGTAVFTVSSSIVAATYQWQMDNGTGYVNLTSAGPYSGVTTPTLTVTGVTAGLHNLQYRCIVSNTWVCKDTSSSATLTVPVGVPTYYVPEDIQIFPNPVKNQLTITSSVPVSSVIITDLLGKRVAQRSGLSNNQVQIDLSAIPSGFYLVRINETEVRKFLKE